MTTLKAILFDAGSTLVLPDVDHLAEVMALPAARLAAADPSVRKTVNRHLMTPGAQTESLDTFRIFFEGLARGAGGHLDAATLQRLRSERGMDSCWRKLNPEAEGLAAKLREKRLRTAIISNSDGRCEEIITALGLMPDFEFVIDSTVVGVAKPDPRIFRIALDRMKLEPHEVAYIGDLPAIDVVGSHAAGLRPILYDPHDVFEDEVRELEARGVGPVRRIRRLQELLNGAG